MFCKSVGAPGQVLLALACCSPLLVLALPTLLAQSTPNQRPNQPFTHNRCDWLPGATFSDDGFKDDVLGIIFKTPDGWHADPKLAALNFTTPPPPRPNDPKAARKYDTLGKSCTLVAVSKNSSQAAPSRYPRVEVDLDFSSDPEQSEEITAKDALDWVSALYKKNPSLKTISEIHEVYLAGLKFFQLDAELFARDGHTHYFHRDLVAPAVNHLALTVRITATSPEDLGTATETLNSLQIDRTRFKLTSERHAPNPSTHK